MKITVLGLWHLGCVTAACCARHFQVAGLDFDAANIARLNQGQAPLLEPGLNELLAAGLAAKKLSFTNDPAAACAQAGITFVGPNVRAIRIMGNKTTSRVAVHAMGVNLVPGMRENLESEEHALAWAKEIGYPVMLKAAAGGGGF